MARQGFNENDNAKPKLGMDADTARLFCSVSGCGSRWTFNTGRPLCGKHAGAKTESFVDMSKFIPMPDVDKGDGKDWARRILAVHAMGHKVRPLSLELARSVRLSGA